MRRCSHHLNKVPILTNLIHHGVAFIDTVINQKLESTAIDKANLLRGTELLSLVSSLDWLSESARHLRQAI